jgi:hypothetical protein
MQYFTTLMDFSQSALFFDLSFQFVILHLLIILSFCCTLFHCLWNTGSPRLSYTIHSWKHVQKSSNRLLSCDMVPLPLLKCT